MGRAEHIYPLLISGDPEHAFPPSLKLVPDVMNRLMDVRSKGDDPGAIMARAETALLKVVADIAGCDNDELLREQAGDPYMHKILSREDAPHRFFALRQKGVSL